MACHGITPRIREQHISHRFLFLGHSNVIALSVNFLNTIFLYTLLKTQRKNYENAKKKEKLERMKPTCVFKYVKKLHCFVLIK